MPLLKQLQLPTKQKIGLMFVFGFGALYVTPIPEQIQLILILLSVCVTSVIRLKSLYEISVSTDTTCAYPPLLAIYQLTTPLQWME